MCDLINANREILGFEVFQLTQSLTLTKNCYLFKKTTNAFVEKHKKCMTQNVLIDINNRIQYVMTIALYCDSKSQI